jgi:gamma-glutamylcyclotransferase (GGCT)/AIG2-like uncharacterized protein YtfP
MIDFVFVYGTLKINQSNSLSFDKDRIFVDKAVISGKLYDLFFYPVLKKGNDKIYGELHQYKNIESVLKRMDEIEGFDKENPKESLFIREKIKIFLDKKEINVYCYYYNDDVNGCEQITSGEWNNEY